GRREEGNSERAGRAAAVAPPPSRRAVRRSIPPRRAADSFHCRVKGRFRLCAISCPRNSRDRFALYGGSDIGASSMKRVAVAGLVALLTVVAPGWTQDAPPN